MSGAAGRGLPRILWLLSAGFILYGGTIPFNFDADQAPLATRIAIASRTLPWQLDDISLPDIVQNVLLFVPFGIFGALSLQTGSWFRVVRVVAAVTVLGCLLSATVEALQLFTSDRTVSLTDLGTNTLGAASGAIAVIVFRRSAILMLQQLDSAGLLEPSTFYPALVFLFLVCIAAWEPFDVTLDVSTVVAKIRALQRDVWQYGGLDDEGVAFVQLALFAGALCSWLHAIGVRSVAMVGVAASLVAGFALEGCQVFIAARQPGLEDALVRAAGGLTGVAVWQVSTFQHRPVRLLPALTAATGVAAALQMLSPFDVVRVYRPIQWIPFLNYYVFTSFNTVSHTIELFLIYFPIGFIAMREAASRRRGMAAGALLALVVAAPVEYGQGWIVGRFADVTDVALSVGGALIGGWTATRGGALLQALRRDQSRRQVRSPSDHSTSSKQAT
jgi:VanZ family protein